MNPPRTHHDDTDSKPWPMWLKTIIGCMLVVIGFDAGWRSWVTSNIYASQSTTATVLKLGEDVKSNQHKLETLPPEEWKTRIRRLEDDFRQNSEDHLQIKLGLEQIKAALGVKPKQE